MKFSLVHLIALFIVLLGGTTLIYFCKRKKSKPTTNKEDAMTQAMVRHGHNLYWKIAISHPFTPAEYWDEIEGFEDLYADNIDQQTFDELLGDLICIWNHKSIQSAKNGDKTLPTPKIDFKRS